MAEIKSTLELVLEKTRHLSMTQEEKEARELAELKAQINGIVTRFKDGLVDADRAADQIRSLQNAHPNVDERYWRDRLAEQVSLNPGDGPVVQLLAQVFSADISAIEQVIDRYRQAYAAAAMKRREAIRQRLRTHHGVSGSAVLPHLEPDELWKETQKRLQDRWEVTLREAKQVSLSAGGSD